MNALLWLAVVAFAGAQAAPRHPSRRNDAEYIVGNLLDSYPRPIGLTESQKTRMRAVYLHVVKTEQAIVKQGGGKFVIRGKVHAVESDAQTKLKKILTPHQYVMLENWQESRRHTHAQHH